MNWPAGFLERRRKRWRWTFALFPVQIRDRWVWLERYRTKGDGVVRHREFASHVGRERDDFRLVMM